MDPYTHKFIFNINDKEVKGECELNTDGLVSYDITSTSKPMPAQTMKDFTEWMDLMHRFYKTSGEIVQVQIKKKEIQ